MTEHNTLDLVGDGDELDLLWDVEAAFEVKIDNEEAEQIFTIGDLRDVLLRKLGADGERRRSACLTAVAFYRLRRAIADHSGRGGVTPATLLDRSLVGADYRRWKRAIETRCGLELPSGEAGLVERWLFVFLVLTGTVASFALVKLFSIWGLLALFGWLPLYPLVRFLPSSRPAFCPDAGSLAREVAGLNYLSLKGEFGGRYPEDVLMALIAVVRNATGFSGPLDRKTTFFA